MSLLDALSRAGQQTIPRGMNVHLALERAGGRVRDAATGGQAVRGSHDLGRIVALPFKEAGTPDMHALTRRPDVDPVPIREANETAAVPERIPTDLKPIQQEALWQAMIAGGLVGFIGAGWGKTGIAALLPTVMQSQCAVIITRSRLKPQLLADLRKWSRCFDVRMSVIHIVTYEDLSNAQTGDLLDRLCPDLVVADEAHRLRHRNAARTKRFLRFFHKHPGTRACFMSGTLSTGSIKDYAHLCAIALRSRSPLPLHYPTLSEWSQALDPSKDGRGALGAGALRVLCRSEREPVRIGFRRRLIGSRGVVATDDGPLSTALVLSIRDLQIPDVVRRALSDLEQTWTRPDGEELEDHLALHRVGAQVSSGFYLRWCWPNGVVDTEWLVARAGWHRAVRYRLRTHARPGGDSPMLLARQADRGEWDCPEWAPWKAVKDRPTPPTEVVWIDGFLVDDAVRWGRSNTGIIWYENDAVGRAISEAGGFQLVEAGNAADRLFAEAAVAGPGRTPVTVVAPFRAHGEGLNLQAWSHGLLAQLPGNASAMEQLLARSHRPNQLAESVNIALYRHTDYLKGAIENSFRQARYLEETTKNRQRLLYAVRDFDVDTGDAPEADLEDTDEAA